MIKIYRVLGILAPICYLAAVITGGFLIEGYSHIYNTISELTASDAPRLLSVQLLFFIYNLSLTLFGIGVCLDRSTGLTFKQNQIFRMVAGVGLLGLAMYFFPQDPRTIAMTFKGRIHIVLAGFESLLTMIAIFLGGLHFKKHAGLKNLSVYSFVTFAVLFITGGAAAAGVAMGSHYGGLFERLTIGAFQQWILVIAYRLLTVDTINGNAAEQTKTA